jgi:hypothetical protein
MTARKGRFTKLWLDGYALTSNATELEASTVYDEIEAGSFGSAAKGYLSGRAESTFGFTGFFDPATAGTHDALQNVGVDKVGGFVFGNNATPTIGDIAGAMPVHQSQYTVTTALDSVIAAEAVNKCIGTPIEWGNLLADVEGVTSTGNTSSYDAGAGSSNGGSGYLFLTGVSASDTITVTIQDSADDAIWNDLITFTLDGSQVDGERITVAGNVGRYLRVEYTISGTSPSFDFAVIFHRG